MKVESKYISKSNLKLIKGPDMCPNCEEGILSPQADEGMPGYYKCPSCGWFGKLDPDRVRGPDGLDADGNYVSDIEAS